jgi:hypothetical protein
MTTVSANLGTKTTLTIGVASLASSSSFVDGRESNQVDNTTNKFLDALLEGFITVGTTPTVNTQILVYVWGSNDSLATTAKDVLDGTDSDETLTSAGIGRGFLKLLAAIDVDSTTSDRRYDFGVVSVAQALGGVLPKYWGIFVTHNTGVALNATTGNHEISYSGIKQDIA